FHIVFPAFTIGLASYLAVLEAWWLATGRSTFLALFNYWKKVFAVTFAMGVVSGLVMSYQFGTNWSVFADKAGPVIGPLMGYEVLTAFFLEAGFLGVMLFGLNKVGRGLHFVATFMVPIGTFISAFWTLPAHSWMQTPAGYTLTHDRNGVVRGLKDWPKEDRPNALILFWSFRVMVGLGLLMLGLGLWSLWGRARATLYDMKALYVAALLMGPMGFVAVLAGWV